MSNFAKDVLGLAAAPTLAREIPVFVVNAVVVAVLAVLAVLAVTGVGNPTALFVAAGLLLGYSLARLAVAARRGSGQSSDRAT